jgi:hypothetical protein
MSIEHATITDPDIHEAKGVAGANAGDVSFADGAGSAAHRQIVIADVSDLDLAGADEGDVFTSDGLGSGAMLPHTPAIGTVTQGVYFYQDSGVPVSLVTPGVMYDLTNDSAGAETITYPIGTLAKMWDEVTNRFIFTDGSVLSLGDIVDFRLDVSVTTSSVNTAITIGVEGGIGGTPIDVVLIPEQNFKTAGTYELVRWMGLFMRNTDVLNLPARVWASSDTAGATVQVHAWLLRASHTNT